MLQKQYLILKYAQHRLDFALGSAHRRNQLSIMLLRELQLLPAGTSQASVAVQLKLAFPFRKKSLGHILHRGNPILDRKGLGFTVVELDLNLPIHVLEFAAMKVSKCTEFIQRTLKLLLGFFQTVPRTLHAADEDVALVVSRRFHGSE